MRINKRFKFVLFFYFFIVMSLFVSENVKANNSEKTIKIEDNQELLISTEEELDCILDSKVNNIPNTTYITSNPLKLTRMTSYNFESKFDLRRLIPENMIIKDQMDTDSCWSFAAIASLETSLALKNYYNNKPFKEYDFSERHMAYSISKLSLTGDITNYEYGLNRYVYNGGNSQLAMLYLTNGMGAVDEESMPFVNSKGTRPIEDILNKKVTSKIIDTIEFPSYDINTITEEEMENIKNKLKYHIINYGGIIASINATGASSTGGAYDIKNFSIFCDDATKCSTNHAVTIVGWDDEFPIEQFSTYRRPNKPGAWIVKNSSGEKTIITTSLENLKKTARNAYCKLARYVKICQDNGWDKDSSLIPDDKIMYLIVEENGYIIDGDNALLDLGGDGYIYVSYEDVNVYTKLTGILNATDVLDYDYLYQHNYFGTNYSKIFETNNENILYLSDIFERNNQEQIEYLTEVSMFFGETNTAKVYVNPNGNSTKKEDLQLVNLKFGDENNSETFEAGYHTLEFESPIKLTGPQFSIVLELKGTRNNEMYLNLEGYNNSEFKSSDKRYYYNVVKVEGQGAYSKDMTNWNKLSEHVLDEVEVVNDSNFIGADTTIKAFTISEIAELRIDSAPLNINYIEGDNFSTEGMKVIAITKEGTELEIDDYEVTNGINLEYGQESIEISYLGASTTQQITVEKNIVESIEITKSPTITNYIEGQYFEPEGMIVTAYYKNGTSVDIKNYDIVGIENSLISNQNSLTIRYEEEGIVVETTQSIEVKEKTLQSITLDTLNVKKSYIEGQSFKREGLKVIANYEYLDIELTEEQYKIIGGEKLLLDTKEVTISYSEDNITATEKIEIEVIAKVIESIKITNSPIKTDYIEEQDFVPEGMKVEATYNDGDIEDITEYITIINGTNLQKGQNQIVIKYQEKETILDINVVEKQIESIDIKKLPIKIEYIEKEELDLTGGIIIIKYDNEKEIEIEMISPEIKTSGFDNSNIGEQEITLAYKEKTTSFKIVVKKEVIPVNSVLEKSIGTLNKIKSYYYTNDNTKNYVIMDTVISKIEKSKENDAMEYYYYLSSKQEENNIDNWIKIDEPQSIENDTLKFTINTKNITNYDEISSSDVLYLYIKEVAIKENKQKTVISSAMKLNADVDIEEYIDDVKQEDNLGSGDDNLTENPGTGSLGLIVACLIGLLSLGYTGYYFMKIKN